MTEGKLHPTRPFDRMFNIHWVGELGAYGYITFLRHDGVILCDSEGLGREFVKAILNQLVDAALFDGEEGSPL